MQLTCVDAEGIVEEVALKPHDVPLFVGRRTVRFHAYPGELSRVAPAFDGGVAGVDVIGREPSMRSTARSESSVELPHGSGAVASGLDTLECR